MCFTMKKREKKKIINTKQKKEKEWKTKLRKIRKYNMKQCGQRSQAAAGSVNKKCNLKKSIEKMAVWSNKSVIGWN